MIALASHQISNIIQEAIGIRVLPLLPYNKLDEPVSSHADMLVCVIDRLVFCYSDYYLENIEIFNEIENRGYKIIKVNHHCGKKYPSDIGLNVLVIGKKIFCKKEFTAKEILSYAENNGYKIINVNQGYSACSTFVINESNAATSDLGMKKSLENEGINVFLVSNDKIILEGYNCGFVGGCGFILDKIAYFFGEIETNEEILRLATELKKHCKEITCIRKGDICDYGGVKILKKLKKFV